MLMKMGLANKIVITLKGVPSGNDPFQHGRSAVNSPEVIEKKLSEFAVTCVMLPPIQQLMLSVSSAETPRQFQLPRTS